MILIPLRTMKLLFFSCKIHREYKMQQLIFRIMSQNWIRSSQQCTRLGLALNIRSSTDSTIPRRNISDILWASRLATSMDPLNKEDAGHL